MAARLQDALSALLAGWRSDLDPAWRAVLDGVEPDFAGVAADLDVADGEVIFPGRKGRAPAGARPDAHVFRALDGITPDDLSVVVMGQDPYTQVTQATGRSFEQGDLRDWLGKPKVTPSLRRMIQALAAVRSPGKPAYLDSAGGWGRIVDDIRAGVLQIEPPRELWDLWQRQGVMFINAILTFNRFKPHHQFDGHGRLWAPVVRALLGHLARRPGRPVVFVTWGGKAQDAFKASGVEAAARAAGTWGKSVCQVKRPHPNALGEGAPFLQGSNPFDEINTVLTAAGGTAIRW
jgi:uracil-DNA glycosylase